MPFLLTVITVCRNAESTLEQTLESVLSQSNEEYEYLVIDGASTDGTTDLLARYASRFGTRLRWISEPDDGIYSAMNKGISMARGEVIGFLNADDYYADTNVLADIRQAFCEHPAIDAVHGSLSFINSAGSVVRYWAGTPYCPGAFARGWMPAHPTFYCRRCCFENFGGFDPSIGSAADFELMLRYIEKHGIRLHCMEREFIRMRLGGASTSGLRAVLRNTRQNQMAFRRNGVYCPWHYPLTRLSGKIAQVLSGVLR